MKAPWSGRLSTAKTGWLVLILFFGWLAFLLIPDPKPKPEPLPAFVVKPPSRLVALGLPDNPDLEHLPEFFALCADKAEWKDDKTIFAYWHPGSNSYSYFFEAARVTGAYHFKAIPEPDNDEYIVENTDDNSTDASPIRRYRHVNVSSLSIGSKWTLPRPSGPHGEPEKQKLPEPIKLPEPELKLIPLDLEPRK